MSATSDRFVPPSLAARPGWMEHHRNLDAVLGYWSGEGYLPADSIAGKDVLDFGGGYGSLSLLLLERGARSVTVLDTGLDEGFFAEHYANIPEMRWHRGTLSHFLASKPASGPIFDLVIASSVTEHVLDLASCLYEIHGVLRPGGVFFTAHDNYYQPSGAHDNFMLHNSPEGFRYVGPACWDAPEKCEASRAFRESMMVSAPWAWDAATDALRDPPACERCPLRRRARPWAHLLEADRFNESFVNPFFSTGRPESGLNKITPFMLRQFILEAGFALELWHRNMVPNVPPPELLGEPHWHNPVDLTTVNILARGRRAA